MEVKVVPNPSEDDAVSMMEGAISFDDCPLFLLNVVPKIRLTQRSINAMMVPRKIMTQKTDCG